MIECKLDYAMWLPLTVLEYLDTMLDSKQNFWMCVKYVPTKANIGGHTQSKCNILLFYGMIATPTVQQQHNSYNSDPDVTNTFERENSLTDDDGRGIIHSCSSVKKKNRCAE